jgi:phosphate:Na+ symporter
MYMAKEKNYLEGSLLETKIILGMLVQLFGGLGLFLYGMKMMGDGLENAAGDRLKTILEKVTSNPVIGILVGASVTCVIQSSSATTVMVVGFVNAGLMNLFQATGIIMGANIGTTITAQLIAFKLTAIAPIFVGIGAIIVMFSKGKQNREIGNIVLGFGILFVGMEFMGDAMSPLKTSPEFKLLMSHVGKNWLLGMLIGLGMTAIIQSSSATTGIIVAMAGTGAIDMNIAIPYIFGCNIGTCVTALLASIGTSKIARKSALIHLSFNVIGTIIFIPLMKPLASIVQNMSPGNIQRQIANAHTIFNILNTFILVWFIKYLVALANKIIPGEDEKENMGVQFIDDRVLQTPVIAVGQMMKEVVRMANKAKENLQISMEAFRNDDDNLVQKVYENEKLINILDQEITTYLVKLSSTELSEEQIRIVTSTFHVVNDIERIGDHAENLADLTSEKITRRLEFSEEAIGELKHIYDYTLNALEVCIDSYEHRDVKKAESIISIEQRIDSLEKELRESHIKRLNNGTCNAFTGAIFLDIISNFERIGDHSTNIAESVVHRKLD